MNDLSSNESVFIKKLNEIIFSNLENENFGVKKLAHEIGLNRFSLNRKLQFICRKTINQYIREERLRHAMEMLLSESVTASEVAFKVGFGSPAYFNTCFSSYFGYPPGEARKRALYSTHENMEELSASSPVENKKSLITGIKPFLGKKKMKRLRRTIAFVSFILLFSIILIYFFNSVIPQNSNFKGTDQLKNQKKSIAVLPFINDSKDPENVYFINGVMEAILDNLSKVKDLQVRPRTTVEQYRNNKTKTVPQIAKELGVNYIIEGSGQKIGSQVSLYIQLIDASSDKHLFSQKYNFKLDSIFNLQSEVAIKVASQINAIITDEERELIKKTHTTNLAALNLFLQANDVRNIAESENKWELNIKAERLYKKAIQLDSTYADPYVALGWIVSKRNIDSAFYLANRALHFDAKNTEAYNLKGDFYRNKGRLKEAEEAYKKSIKFNPNNSLAFLSLGDLYFYEGNGYDAIKNQLQAFQLENNMMQERLNVQIFNWNLNCLGFYKEGEKYNAKLLELTNDSTYYYIALTLNELDYGNYKSALHKALKMYACNPENLDNIYFLFHTYLYVRDFKKASLLMQKYIGIMKKQGRAIEPDPLFGFCYLENGQKEEADFHFEGTIKRMLKYIEQNQPTINGLAYITLAKIYSARNEKGKALENLKKAEEYIDFNLLRTKDYNYCTMFDNIRQEPEYARFVKQTAIKSRKEHAKVEKLLQEAGILVIPVK